MKPTTDPTEWAQHLRSINQAFELRETALLAKLEKVTKQLDQSGLRNDELTTLPQTQLEQLDQSAQDLAKSKQEQYEQISESRQTLARLVERHEAETRDFNARFAELRESERARFQAELQARLAEQRLQFEAERRDVRADLHDGEIFRLQQEMHARLEEKIESVTTTLEETRTAEFRQLKAEYQDRQDARERAYRTELEDLRLQLRDGLRHAQQKEIEFNEIVARVKETARTEFEAQLQEQLVREQKASAQLLSLHQQYDLSRANLSASHHDQLMAIEASQREHYRNWRSLADALEAQLRDRLDAERALRAQVQGVLDSVQHELSEVRGSFLYRAARFWRRTDDLSNRSPPARSSEDSVMISRNLASADVPLLHAGALLTIPGFANHMSGIRMEQPLNSAQTARSIDELLYLCDIPFVNCAYWTILGRAPDPSGLKNYLDQVRRGVSKGHIVAELTQSEEGRNRTIKLPGLPELLNIHNARGAWWLGRRNVSRSRQALEMQLRSIENRIGFVGYALDRATTDRPFEAQLQIVREHMDVLANEQYSRIDKLNTSLSDVHAMLVHTQADNEWEIAGLRAELRALSSSLGQSATATPAIRNRSTQQGSGPRGDRDASAPIRISRLMNNVLQETDRIRAKLPGVRPADQK